MDSHAEDAAVRAIDLMEQNLGAALTVDDIARAALFSKFHFTRLFQRTTGLSPGRFLSAMRLQRAKSLLLSTTMNVADVSVTVGYNSVGTFSSRFTRSVGLAPTEFRRSGGVPSCIPDGVIAHSMEPCTSAVGHAEVRFTAPVPANRIGAAFVGFFRTPLPEGPAAQLSLHSAAGSARQGSGVFLDCLFCGFC